MDAHVNVPHHGGNIVKNSRHLQFLVYTVDFDGRRTRKQMLTGQMPVELMGTTRDCDEWVNVMKNTYDHVRSIMALDEAKRVEYEELFAPKNYDPARNDLQHVLLPRVVESLQLTAQDVFCDLGSSTGALVLAVRMLSPCRRAIGVELSPSRTSCASAALERLSALPEGSTLLDGQTSFLCGDISDASLIPAATTYFFGTGSGGRKQLIPKVIAAICTVNKSSTFRSVRVICAGFALPCVEGIEIRYGVAFEAHDAHLTKKARGAKLYKFDETDEPPLEASEPLRDYGKFYESFYGETVGPRVLVFCTIDLDKVATTKEF